MYLIKRKEVFHEEAQSTGYCDPGRSRHTATENQDRGRLLWSKRTDGQPIPPRSDTRWQSIKSKVESVAKGVETFASKRGPSQFKLDIRIERLRGSHGQMLLENLRGRIEATDIFVMDIGSSDGKSFNSNVLIETGMAIAMNAAGKRLPFILKPAEIKPPPSFTVLRKF